MFFLLHYKDKKNINTNKGYSAKYQQNNPFFSKPETDFSSLLQPLSRKKKRGQPDFLVTLISFARLSVLLFCWSFCWSFSSFSRSIGRSWHIRRGCRGFHCGKRSNHILQFALGSAFFGVLGECNARKETKHHQDAAQSPCGFLKEIARLTHAHHLVGTSEIRDQTATF